MTTSTIKTPAPQAPDATAGSRADASAREASPAGPSTVGASTQPVPSLASPTAALSGLGSTIGGALTRAADQHRTDQLSAFTWSAAVGVLTKVVPSIAPDDRRRVEELQNQLQLVLEEKKKQRKGFDGRDPVFFEQLVAVLGQRAAEQLAQQIEQAVSEQGAALQNDPAAVAELLGALLASGDTLVKFGVSPQAVENALRVELAPTRLARFAPVSASFIPANLPTESAPVIGPDLLAAVKAEPATVGQFLTTAQGAQVLRDRLAAAGDADRRVALLQGLKEVLGADRFVTVIDAYDTHTGVPLVFALVQMSQPAVGEQQSVLQKLLDPGQSLLTATQRERLSGYLISDAALVMQSLRSEYEAIPARITELESSRMQRIRHFAAVLGIDAPVTADPKVLEGTLLQELAKQYPGLGASRALTLVEARDALRTLATTDPNDVIKFREIAAKLGVNILPDRPPAAALAGLTPQQHARVEQEHYQKVIHEMGLLKEKAERLVTHVNELTLTTTEIASLHSMQDSGPNDELGAVFLRLKETYARSIPEFTRERVEQAQGAMTVYLNNLESRIASATEPSVIQALSLERDSIEWRALQARIAVLLTREPPDSDRAFSLLAQFQGVHVDGGPSRRSAEYLNAATSLVESLNHVINYYQQVSHLLDIEGQQSSEREREASDNIDKAKPVIKQLETDVGTWWWNSDRADQRQTLERYQANMVSWTAQKHNNQEKQKRLEGYQKLLVEHQRRALAVFGSSGNFIPIGATSSEVKAQLDSCGASSAQSLDGLRQAQELADRAAVQGAAALSRASLVGAVACTRSSFDPSVSSVVLTLQTRISEDVTLVPTREALAALRAVAPVDSLLGQMLADPTLATRSPREQMDVLYARLGNEDVLRTKIFLLACDQPSVVTRLGIEGVSDSKTLWQKLSALRESEEHHELGALLANVAPLRTLAAAERVMSGLRETERGVALEEYRRLASQSLGQMLLNQAPLGADARRVYLCELAASPLVNAVDMAPLFPGGVVPTEAPQRRVQLERLLMSDAQAARDIPQDFTDLIQQQSEQRAGLLAALPTMIALGRTADVEAIRRRLGELDSQYARSRDFVLSSFGSEYVARSGTRQWLASVRDMSTQTATARVADPHGEIAQEAQRVAQMLADKNISSEDVAHVIRRLEYSPDQMMLFEVMYARYVGSRPSLTLRGDVQRDLQARLGGSGEQAARKVELLLAGGATALTEYDLIQLTEAIRSRDPHLTTRAMLYLEGKEGGRALLLAAVEKYPEFKQFLKDNVGDPAWRGASALWDAVQKNDTTRIAAIKTVEGIGWAGQKTSEGLSYAWNEVVIPGADRGFQSLGSAVRDIYGQSLSEIAAVKMPAVGAAWNDLLSSDPVSRARGVAAATQEMIRAGQFDFTVMAGLNNFITPQQAKSVLKEMDTFVTGLPNSFTYVKGERGAFIQYVAQRGGPLGEADSRMLEAILAPAAGAPLSPEALRRYTLERERLKFQLLDANSLDAQRKEVHTGAQNFFQTICSTQSGARTDRDGRWASYNLANDVVREHEVMRLDQRGLITHQQAGLEDIRATSEEMRVRALAILDDVRREVDGGLSADQNERDFGELRQRDQKREWIVARKEVVDRWLSRVEVAQEALASWDGWVSFGYTAGKVALLTGLALSGVGTPWVLGAAIAMNAAEKAYMVAFRGMSLREGLRQFAIELAIDCALVGAGRLLTYALRNVKIATPFFRHTATIERDGVKEAVTKTALGRHGMKGAGGEVVKITDPGLTNKVKGIIKDALDGFNRKIGDAMLHADRVHYTVERIYLRLRVPPLPPPPTRPAPSNKPQEAPTTPRKLDTPADSVGAGQGAGKRSDEPPSSLIVADATNKPGKPAADQPVPPPQPASVPQAQAIEERPTPAAEAAEAKLEQLVGRVGALAAQYQGTEHEPTIRTVESMINEALLQRKDPAGTLPLVEPYLASLPQPLLAQQPSTSPNIEQAQPTTPPLSEVQPQPAPPPETIVESPTPAEVPPPQPPSGFQQWLHGDATESFVLMDGLLDNTAKWFGLTGRENQQESAPPPPHNPPANPPQYPPADPGTSRGPSYGGTGPVIEVVDRRANASAEASAQADATAARGLQSSIVSPEMIAQAQEKKIQEEQVLRQRQEIANTMARIDTMLQASSNAQQMGNANQTSNAYVQSNSEQRSIWLKDAQTQPMAHSLAMVDTQAQRQKHENIQAAATPLVTVASERNLIQEALKHSAHAGNAQANLSTATQSSGVSESSRQEAHYSEQMAKPVAARRSVEKHQEEEILSTAALVDKEVAREARAASVVEVTSTTVSAAAQQEEVAASVQSEVSRPAERLADDEHAVRVVARDPEGHQSELLTEEGLVTSTSATSALQARRNGDVISEVVESEEVLSTYADTPDSADVIDDLSYRTEPLLDSQIKDVGVEDKSDRARKEAIKIKKAKQREKAAKMRMFIMQQLLAQHFERSKRERLLRMLIALGISEKEYRDLVAQLDAADQKRQDEQLAVEQKEKIAIAIEQFQKPAAPAMKAEAPKGPTQKSPGHSKTRAELYARLRSVQGKQIH